MIQNDINLLTKQTKDKYIVLLKVCLGLGLKIKPFETFRSKERQQYLYNIGRTIQKSKKPVTRTLNSKHIKGEAIDTVFIVNNQPSRQGDRSTFHYVAEYVGLDKILNETCHVQDDGITIKKTMERNSELRKATKDIKLQRLLNIVNSEFRLLGYK